MKLFAAFAIVLPSLITLSCVTGDVLTAPRNSAAPVAGSSEAAIAELVQAHHDSVASLQNSGGARPLYDCH